jgi:hypothetical protein
MMPKNQKIFVIVAVGLVIIGLFYSFNSDTVFSKFFEQFDPVDWDEVKPREIVKNSIPITIIEDVDGKCKVHGEKFDLIIDHQYFIRSNELAEKLQYDRENKTLIIPCEELVGEKSRLNVWYVILEAEKHATKYEYFITEWEETPPNQN